MAETTVEIKIDNDVAHISKHTLFGMKFPDGTNKWGVLDADGGTIEVQRLAEGKADEVQRWNATLLRKARAALIDYEQYKAGHTIVQREVILSVGEITEWGHGGTLPAEQPAPAMKAPWA